MCIFCLSAAVSFLRGLVQPPVRQYVRCIQPPLPCHSMDLTIAFQLSSPATSILCTTSHICFVMNEEWTSNIGVHSVNVSFVEPIFSSARHISLLWQLCTVSVRSSRAHPNTPHITDACIICKNCLVRALMSRKSCHVANFKKTQQNNKLGKKQANFPKLDSHPTHADNGQQAHRDTECSHMLCWWGLLHLFRLNSSIACDAILPPMLFYTELNIRRHFRRL